jgi:hypothetical protein
MTAIGATMQQRSKAGGSDSSKKFVALVSETKTHVEKISVVTDNIYSDLGFLISRQNADSARIEEIGANVAKLDTKIDILIAQIGSVGTPS